MALLVAGAIGIALSRHAPRNTVILLASLIAIDLFIVGSWFGVEKLAQRLVQTSAHDVELRGAGRIRHLDDPRLCGIRIGARHVLRHVPALSSADVLNFYDETHNDYVRVRLGNRGSRASDHRPLVAASLWRPCSASGRRRDPLMRGMSFACSWA